MATSPGSDPAPLRLVPHSSSMTRAQNTTIWGLALVVGAFVLGRGEDTLPLAVGAAGVVAVIAGGLVALNERDAAQFAAREESEEPDTDGA